MSNFGHLVTGYKRRVFFKGFSLAALFGGALVAAAPAETEAEARNRATKDYQDEVLRLLNTQAGSGWVVSDLDSTSFERRIPVAGTPLINYEAVILTPLNFPSILPTTYAASTYLNVQRQDVIVSGPTSAPQFRHEPDAHNTPLPPRDLAVISYLTSNIQPSALTNINVYSGNANLPREMNSPYGPIATEYSGSLGDRMLTFSVMGENGVPMRYRFIPNDRTQSNGNLDGRWIIQTGVINQTEGLILRDGRVVDRSYWVRTIFSGLTENQFTPAQRRLDDEVGQNQSIFGRGTTRARMQHVGRLVNSVPRPSLARKSNFVTTLGL